MWSAPGDTMLSVKNLSLVKSHPFATPFTGLIKDNDGKVRLEKGAMTDDALSKMDYYVEGVAGKLPVK